MVGEDDKICLFDEGKDNKSTRKDVLVTGNALSTFCWKQKKGAGVFWILWLERVKYGKRGIVAWKR